jgi:hypothetical protein
MLLLQLLMVVVANIGFDRNCELSYNNTITFLTDGTMEKFFG